MTSSTYNKARRRRTSRLPRTLSPGTLFELARRLMQRSPLRQPLELSPFDSLIGKMVCEALAGTANRQLSEEQRECIAAQADAAGFALKEQLEGKWKKHLALRNQQNSRKPDKMITTFSQALKDKQELRRGVLRTFYRAKENYLRSRYEVSDI